MTDERDRSGYPNQPYTGEPERAEGGIREGNPRDPNGRDPQQHRPFGEQDHRGPRRSRYGRRRMPGDGPGNGPGNSPGNGPNDYAGEQRDHRPPRTAEDDVETYLPSFIAGSSGTPDPFANTGSGHAPSHTQGYGQGPGPAHAQAHDPGHDQGHGQGSPQGYQGHPRDQGHQGHPGQSREHGGYQGGGYQGGHQPIHHGEPPMMNPGLHQPMHQVVQHQPEEPSPEVQAAAAELAEWEASNPKLRGLLICNPTYKRGEPVVRGTRIPARILAAIAKMGSSVEEMLQDYPALSREGLDAALAFAAAHPRQTR